MVAGSGGLEQWWRAACSCVEQHVNWSSIWSGTKKCRAEEVFQRLEQPTLTGKLTARWRLWHEHSHHDASLCTTRRGFRRPG